MTGQENSSGLWWRWELPEAAAGSLLRLFQSLYLQGETPTPPHQVQTTEDEELAGWCRQALRGGNWLRETSQCRGNGNPWPDLLISECKRVAPVVPRGQRCEETCLLEGAAGETWEGQVWSAQQQSAEHRRLHFRPERRVS